jgi:CheY-like chemotaxis protein
LDILLPRARPEGASPKPAKEPRDSRRRAPTVLLVDDEPMVRELGRNVLERSGFQVLLAEDGTEAIDVYRHEMAHVDLVVLDLTMPSLSGDDTFRRLVKINPRVRVLFCSGYPSEHVRSLGQEQVVGFISKPYRNEDLLRAVRAAIG